MTSSAVVGMLRVLLTANTTAFQSALQGASAQTIAFTSRMTDIGRQATALGAALTKTLTIPITAIGAASIKAYASFDQAMTSSLAIMSDVSDEMRQTMKQTAIEISRTSTFSAAEAARAYYYLASAGYDAAQAVQMLPNVARFAQAAEMDLAKATEQLVDVQAALGLRVREGASDWEIYQKNTENMIRVSDVLTKANILSDATMQQLADSLTNKGAGALKLVGKELEEGAALLAAWAERGVKGEEAGEKLNQVLRDLQTQAIKHPDVFKRLGVEVFDAAGEMNNMADIVADLTRALLPLSDEQRRSTIMMMGFQDRSVAATASLIGTANSIRYFEAQLRLAKGTTQEVAEKQMKSFIAQAEVMWHSVTEIGIAIGRSMAPALEGLMYYLKDAAQFVQALANRFTELPRSVQTFVFAIAGIAAVLGPLLYLMGQTAFSIMAIASAFSSKGIAMRALTAFTLDNTRATVANTAAHIANAGAVAGGGGVGGIVAGAAAGAARGGAAAVQTTAGGLATSPFTSTLGNFVGSAGGTGAAMAAARYGRPLVQTITGGLVQTGVSSTGLMETIPALTRVTSTTSTMTAEVVKSTSAWSELKSVIMVGGGTLVSSVGTWIGPVLIMVGSLALAARNMSRDWDEALERMRLALAAGMNAPGALFVQRMVEDYNDPTNVNRSRQQAEAANEQRRRVEVEVQRGSELRTLSAEQAEAEMARRRTAQLTGPDYVKMLRQQQKDIAAIKPEIKRQIDAFYEVYPSPKEAQIKALATQLNVPLDVLKAYRAGGKEARKEIKDWANDIKDLTDRYSGLAATQQAQKMVRALKVTGVEGMSEKEQIALFDQINQLAPSLAKAGTAGQAALAALRPYWEAVMKVAVGHDAAAKSAEIMAERIEKARAAFYASWQSVNQSFQSDLGERIGLMKSLRASEEALEVDSLEKRQRMIREDYAWRRNELIRDSQFKVGNLAILNQEEKNALELSERQWKEHLVEVEAQFFDFGNAIRDIIGNIPNLIVQAFTGGGGLGNALNAFVTQFGDKIGQLAVMAGGVFNDIANKFSQLVGKVFGSKAATSIGAALPSIGGAIFGGVSGWAASQSGFGKGAALLGLSGMAAAQWMQGGGGINALTGLGQGVAGGLGGGLGGMMTGMAVTGNYGKGWGALAGAGQGALMGAMYGGPIGAAVGGLMGLMGGLFGKSAKEKVNDARDEFLKQFGGAGTGKGSGFGELAAQLHELGKRGDDIFQRVISAKNMKEFESATKDAVAALDELKRKQEEIKGVEAEIAALRAEIDKPPTWEAVSSIIEKYKLDMNSLGAGFAQFRLNIEAKDIVDALETMAKTGADMNAVVFGMREELGVMVADALRFGVTLPENLRPFIEQLALSGQLLDANGDKIDDISGLKWGEPIKSEAEIMKEALDALIKKLDELVKALRGDLPDAARDGLNNVDEIINRYEPPGLHVPIFYDDPGYQGQAGKPGSGTPEYASGGTGYFGSGALAMLHGHEAIVPINGVKARAGLVGFLKSAARYYAEGGAVKPWTFADIYRAAVGKGTWTGSNLLNNLIAWSLNKTTGTFTARRIDRPAAETQSVPTFVVGGIGDRALEPPPQPLVPFVTGGIGSGDPYDTGPVPSFVVGSSNQPPIYPSVPFVSGGSGDYEGHVGYFGKFGPAWVLYQATKSLTDAARSLTKLATGNYMAGGGVVGFPGQPLGTDTVPAWLTPGEWVLNDKQQRTLVGALMSGATATAALAAAMNAPGEREFSEATIVVINNKGMTSDSLVEQVMRALPRRTKRNELSFRTHMREALGVGS